MAVHGLVKSAADGSPSGRGRCSTRLPQQDEYPAQFHTSSYRRQKDIYKIIQLHDVPMPEDRSITRSWDVAHCTFPQNNVPWWSKHGMKESWICCHCHWLYGWFTKDSKASTLEWTKRARQELFNNPAVLNQKRTCSAHNLIWQWLTFVASVKRQRYFEKVILVVNAAKLILLWL